MSHLNIDKDLLIKQVREYWSNFNKKFLLRTLSDIEYVWTYVTIPVVTAFMMVTFGDLTAGYFSLSSTMLMKASIFKFN